MDSEISCLRIYVLEFLCIKNNTPVIAVSWLALAVFRVADAVAFWAHLVEKRILFAIDVCFDKVEGLSRCSAFLPEFVSGSAPENQCACVYCFSESFFVRIGNKDDIACVDVLNGHRYNVPAFIGYLANFIEINIEFVSFFELIHKIP